jgi:hypothetical protein
VLTATPILPGIESQQAWEEHRDGILQSIAPVGYLEKLLAVKLASISWRLDRVVRYEAEVAAAAVARSEPDLEERKDIGSGKPADPAEAYTKVKSTYLIAELLNNLPNMADEKVIETEVAVGALWALWALSEELPGQRDAISVPGIPDDDDEFDAFDNWTAGLFRKAVAAYAAVARIPSGAFRKQCMFSVRKSHDAALNRRSQLLDQQQRWKLLLERENRSRMLLEPSVLGTVTRYESNLERSFFRTLHEIQRLQAARSGAVVPLPAALDVDLTVRPEPSEETADNAFEDEVTKRTQLSPEK